MNIKLATWRRSSLVVALLLTLGAGCADAAIAKVVSTYQGSTDGNPFTTTAISTTGATGCAVTLAGFGGTLTLTDSPGNTYGTATMTATTAATYTFKTWVIFGLTTSGTHTFTTAGSAFGPSIGVLCFSGTGSTSETPATVTNATSTSIQPGSVTPSLANEVLVAVLASANSETNIDSNTGPFGTADGTVASTGNHVAIGMAFEIQTTATARNPTWNVGGSGDNAAGLVAIRGAAAAAGCTDSHMLGVWRCDEATGR